MNSEFEGYDFSRVLGIDPSLASTGWADLHTKRSGTIKTTAKDARRLRSIYRELHQVFCLHNPSFVVIEDLPANAMSAGLTGQAQGVIRLLLQQQPIPYLALSPATVKKLVAGSGRADKSAMMDAVKAAGYGPRNHDEADAYAMALAGLTIVNSDLPAPKGGWKINGY